MPAFSQRPATAVPSLQAPSPGVDHPDPSGRSSRLARIALACLSVVALAACGAPSPQGEPGSRPGLATLPILSSANGFAVLAGQTVTNTGPTNVTGDLGVSPGSAVTGFPPGLVSGGTTHAADAVALQAQTDLTAAYTDLASRACDFDSSNVDLAGRTLVAGVYCFSSSALLSGELVLDAQGTPGAVFIFQIASTLTTASSASIRMINGGQPCNVFWQVGSSATIGTGTAFLGSILALTSIDLATGATVSGRVLARNGAVTLDSNSIALGSCTGCSGTVCGGACVDTGADEANCGACGNVCAAGATCTSGVCAASPPLVCRDLGPAKPFDVFTLEGFLGNGSSVEGAVGVGGDFEAYYYSIGRGLPPGSLALLIGNDLKFKHGTVNGDVIYGDQLCWICDVVVAGTVTYGRPLDFAAASTYLLAFSASLAPLPANGTTTLQGGTILLEGTSATLNVFTVPSELLTGAQGVEVRVPASSSVLVNVTGSGTAQLKDLVWNLNGLPSGRMLLNFPTATGLDIQGTTIDGTILAPLAAVQFTNGLVTGQVISRSFEGDGRVDTAPFGTCINVP